MSSNKGKFALGLMFATLAVRPSIGQEATPRHMPGELAKPAQDVRLLPVVPHNEGMPSPFGSDLPSGSQESLPFEAMRNHICDQFGVPARLRNGKIEFKNFEIKFKFGGSQAGKRSVPAIPGQIPAFRPVVPPEPLF